MNSFTEASLRIKKIVPPGRVGLLFGRSSEWISGFVGIIVSQSQPVCKDKKLFNLAVKRKAHPFGCAFVSGGAGGI